MVEYTGIGEGHPELPGVGVCQIAVVGEVAISTCPAVGAVAVPIATSPEAVLREIAGTACARGVVNEENRVVPP